MPGNLSETGRSMRRRARDNGAAVDAPHIPAVTREHLIAAAIVFVASLLTYIFTLAPTVTGEDSGELISAAYTLGIPHPPGYPLWCMVTWFFLQIPVGDVAFRANLASAFCAAAANGLMVLLLARLGVRPLLAAGAALLMAVSSTLWGQSVITEVYALTFLTLVGLLYCLTIWRQCRVGAHADDPRGDGWMLGAALICGLSLGTHDTILLLYLPVLLYVIWVGRGRLLRPLVWVMIVGCMLLGLSAFLYLPLRAAAHPAMNWGDPETWDRFWDHVLRKQYPSLWTTHALALTFGQMKALVHYFVSQWPWPVSVIVACGAIAGVVNLWRRDRPLGVWLCLWIFVMSIVFTGILNFQLDEEALHVAEVFFIPAWFGVVLLFAIGVEDLCQRPALRTVGGAVVVALAVIALLANWSDTTMAGNDVARRYGQDILATLPQDAIVFTSADYEAFPLKYLQIVEKQRPDVAALDWQRDIDLALRLSDLAPPSTAQPDDSDVARLMTESKRPIYSTLIMAAVPGTAVHSVGLLYRTFNDPKNAATAPSLDAAAWKTYSTSKPDGPWRSDWSTACMLAAYDIARARSALSYQHDARTALALIKSAADRLLGDPGRMNSLGALLAREGQPETALEYYRRAIALNPTYAEAQFNLITTLMDLGRWREAQEAYAHSRELGLFKDSEAGRNIEDTLLKVQSALPQLQSLRDAAANNPGDAAAWMRLGMLETQLNHFAEAQNDFQKVVAIEPDLSLAWWELGVVCFKRDDRNGAVAAWQKLLTLHPNAQQAEAVHTALRRLGVKE